VDTLFFLPLKKAWIKKNATGINPTTTMVLAKGSLDIDLDLSGHGDYLGAN
jgi:hypothetical protein